MAKTKKKSTESSKWEITNNRFVGFIDIMGFKDLVARNSHASIYKMMMKTTKALKINQSVYGYDYENDDNVMNIVMITFSDSIMIYSKDNTKNSLENFIGAIAGLTEDLFMEGIPHKGAIAYGKMTLDFYNSIFFGQPLIDAYLLQEELNFYGIVVHATAEYKNSFGSDESVLEYNCPFKSGYARHLTVLPSTFIADPYEIKQFKSLLKSVTKLNAKTSGALRKYIDNTKNHLETANEQLQNRITEYKKKQQGSSKKKNIDLPF